MSFTVRIEWDGLDELGNAIVDYGERILEALRQVADYFEPVMEDYAKNNAPWTDRTGNARQMLNAFVEELSTEVVAIYLAHGMDYGKYLELRFQGRYAIIWPTIEAHLNPIREMLQEVFS